MHQHKSSLATVILAAGRAKRFGNPKQLAHYQGKSLINRAIDVAISISPTQPWVILGAHEAQITSQTDLSAARVIFNPEWHSGMASSIRVAVQHLGATYDAILFLSVDQPLINADDLRSITDAWKENPKQLVCAAFLGQIGIPALFPSRTFPQLLTLEGDRGGKKILQQHKQRLTQIALANAAYDIDTVDDLDNLKIDDLDKLIR